jgi:chromosomal replication initiator protein
MSYYKSKSETGLNFHQDQQDKGEFLKSIQKGLIGKYGQDVFSSWFNSMKIQNYSYNKISFSVPNNFFRQWIQDNYIEYIKDLCSCYDPDIKDVRLIVKEDDKDEVQVNVPSSKNLIMSGSNLDDRFTFDNFVVGNSNQLAYEASRAVSEANQSISESNPLFLYGGVGLGKTHLMHAIAWHIKNSNPDRKVIYMSAEKFMYQFVRALRNREIMSFKDKFRSVDVLMIDDIQFICGKESTQEEFFHTFNNLIDNNRQMVISCDRSPSDLDNIEERIKSRLGWGLVADVHRTTYELRLGILQSKVEKMQIHIPKEILEFIASSITSNVRELEGALNKVIAHTTLIGSEVNLSNVQGVLSSLIKSNKKFISLDQIQKKISQYYQVSIDDLLSSSRSRNLVKPRQIGMYIMKSITKKTLSEISKIFGRKDHTTVIHAIKSVEDAMRSSDPSMKNEVEELIDMVKKG